MQLVCDTTIAVSTFVLVEDCCDPRIETVVRIISAMGGSLDKINAIERIEKAEIPEESQIKALVAVKEVYEERIKDLKASSAEQIQSLKRDKKILTFTVFALGTILLGAFLLDLFIGTIGWFRF